MTCPYAVWPRSRNLAETSRTWEVCWFAVGAGGGVWQLPPAGTSAGLLQVGEPYPIWKLQTQESAWGPQQPKTDCMMVCLCMRANVSACICANACRSGG